eukprot:CAMPEP_0171381204 /NCGR_PEP_ID=MMETSP0879-20121228/31316_1 /TAXON_ID=67004 /ORGANISM="Thalassiosira weissflogii, Strain CCMP1336" /LENGTH=614 /DNA_ID=CAMNT_0011892579 /DNA_START=150 /DNA_END=1994 /DNA_ORIENTATION=-
MIQLNLVAFALLIPDLPAIAHKHHYHHHLFPDKVAKSGKSKSTMVSTSKSAKMLKSKSSKIGKSAKSVLYGTNSPTISHVSSSRVDPDDIILQPVGNQTEPSTSPTSANFIPSALPIVGLLVTGLPSVAPSSDPKIAYPDQDFSPSSPSNVPSISTPHHDSLPPFSSSHHGPSTLQTESPSSLSGPPSGFFGNYTLSSVPSTAQSYYDSSSPSSTSYEPSLSPSSLPSRARPIGTKTPSEFLGKPESEGNSLKTSNMPSVSHSYHYSQSPSSASNEPAVPPSQSFEGSGSEIFLRSKPSNMPSTSSSKEDSQHPSSTTIPEKHLFDMVSSSPSETPSATSSTIQTTLSSIYPQQGPSSTPSSSPTFGVNETFEPNGVSISGPKAQCKNSDFTLSNETTIELSFFYRAETIDVNGIEFLPAIEQNLLELVADRVLVCGGIFQRRRLSRWQVAAVLSNPKDTLSAEHNCYPSNVAAESCHVIEGKMTFILGSLNITGMASAGLYAAIRAAFESFEFDHDDTVIEVIYLGEQLSTLTMFDINLNTNVEVKKDSYILKTVLISTFSFLAVMALMILGFSRHQTEKNCPDNENDDALRDNGNDMSSVCAETGAAAVREA